MIFMVMITHTIDNYLNITSYFFHLDDDPLRSFVLFWQWDGFQMVSACMSNSKPMNQMAKDLFIRYNPLLLIIQYFIDRIQGNIFRIENWSWTKLIYMLFTLFIVISLDRYISDWWHIFGALYYDLHVFRRRI